MAGGSQNKTGDIAASPSRRARSLPDERDLRNPATAFCPPATSDLRSIDELIDRLRDVG
jgi:hypothetical protein